VLFIEPYLLRGSTVGWVASTLAIAFALRGMIGAVFTRPAYVFPDPFHFENVGRNGVVSIAGASVQVRSFFVIGLAAGMAALAAWTLERTRRGRALQAISSDPEAARFVGLPVETLVALAFGLVGGLAALTAVAAAPSAPFTVDSGALLGVKGLVAALIVRFGSPWAAFAAGLGVGLAEAAIDNLRIGGFGLGPQYGELIPLGVALGVIAYRSLRTEPVASTA
jgi:branched-chain amino acid transport system permease protein